MGRNALRAAALVAVVLVALGSVSAASELPPAQAPDIEGEVQPTAEHILVLKKLIQLVVYGAAGLLLLLAGLKAAEVALPIGLKTDVAQEKNTAAALVFAALLVALGLVLHAVLTHP